MGHSKATAKTGHNKQKALKRPKCSACGGPKQAVRYAGMKARYYGGQPTRKGMYWLCDDSNCGHAERTGN